MIKSDAETWSVIENDEIILRDMSSADAVHNSKSFKQFQSLLHFVFVYTKH